MLKTKHSGIKTDFSLNQSTREFDDSYQSRLSRKMDMKSDSHLSSCGVPYMHKLRLTFHSPLLSTASPVTAPAKLTLERLPPPSSLLPFPFFRDRDHRLRPSQSRRDHLIDDKMSNVHYVLFIALFETMEKYCFHWFNNATST